MQIGTVLHIYERKTSSRTFKYIFNLVHHIVKTACNFHVTAFFKRRKNFMKIVRILVMRGRHNVIKHIIKMKQNKIILEIF